MYNSLNLTETLKNDVVTDRERTYTQHTQAGRQIVGSVFYLQGRQRTGWEQAGVRCRGAEGRVDPRDRAGRSGTGRLHNGNQSGKTLARLVLSERRGEAVYRG